MANPAECNVCFTIYDETERRPRTLPCGHTFCSPCIVDIMEGGQLSCPNCRAHHPATSLDLFPISYAVEGLVKHLKATKVSSRKDMSGETPPPTSDATSITAGATGHKKPTGISRKLRSLLEEQKNNLNSVVAGSKKVQSQLDQYRAHLADRKTQHLHLLDRLAELVQQNKSALELLEQEDTRVLGMKEERKEGEKQVEFVLGCLNTVDTAQEAVTSIDHADHCVVEAEDWMQKCRELFPDVIILSTSMKVCDVTRMALEALTDDVGVTPPLEDPTLSIMEKVNMMLVAKKLLHVDDLRSMRPIVKRLVEAGFVFGVQEDQGGLRSSRITLENGQLYLHCLLDQVPPQNSSTLPVSEVVEALDPSSTLVFLDLTWPGSTRGRVQIRLSPDNSLARQFVLLCTGQRGHSYLNTLLYKVMEKGRLGERVVGGDYQHNNGKGGDSLLPHPKKQYPTSSGRAGEVVLGYSLERSAPFVIFTSDDARRSKNNSAIGEVESGLEVVKAAVNHIDISQVTVVDCGVVVPL